MCANFVVMYRQKHWLNFYGDQDPVTQLPERQMFQINQMIHEIYYNQIHHTIDKQEEKKMFKKFHISGKRKGSINLGYGFCIYTVVLVVN